MVRFLWLPHKITTLEIKLITKMLFAITCVLAALGIASGAIEADKVTKLPGFVGDLPSTHYSGCKIKLCALLFVCGKIYSAPIYGVIFVPLANLYKTTQISPPATCLASRATSTIGSLSPPTTPPLTPLFCGSMADLDPLL